MFDFSLALHHLKEGQKVARYSWGGGTFIYLVPGSAFAVNRPPLLGIYPEGTEIIYQPHIDIRLADVCCATWAPNHDDLLAEDWIVIA